MNERDMEYLGSINTSPGPNAGKSIEPTNPGPDASAKEVATKIASRPALARLIDTGAFQFSEMCDLRDDIEKALRSRPDASAGLIEAAEWQCPNCMCAICTEIRSRAADMGGK